MLLEEIQTDDLTIYCDMDGVLVNFIAGMEDLLGFENYSEQRYETDNKYKDEMWKRLRDYQKNGGEFWYELKPMADAKQLWDYITQYHVEILSATGYSSGGAAEQKKKWIPEHMGDVPMNLVTRAQDKAQYATPNSILIDDKEKAINPFVQAGGIGVLHTSAADTIQQLKKLGL